MTQDNEIPEHLMHAQRTCESRSGSFLSVSLPVASLSVHASAGRCLSGIANF